MSSKYEGWLTFNGEKEKLKIPVLPPKLPVMIGSKDSSIDILDLGEVPIAKNGPLITVSFSSYFPPSHFPGVDKKDIIDPLSAVNKILKWKKSVKPVHFIVSGIKFDLYVRISKFKYEPRAEDYGAIYYDIELKEWRETSIRSVTVSQETAVVSNNSARPNNTTRPQTYTVKYGDCLWTIAEMMYGDGMRYIDIYNANRRQIDSNYTIYPGQVLTIP